MVIIKLLVVIALLMVLLTKKVNMALSLLISSVALLLINGRGPSAFAGAVAQTFTESATYTLALTILFIGILGYLMNTYGMLDRMVESLERLVRSAKVTIMLAPTLIGLLLVTGGALMSCPIVDTLGQRLGLPNEKRAAINMIFRHGLYFAYPLSTTIIFAAQLGGFGVMDMIKIQFPVTIVMYILGYIFFLRGVADVKAPKLSPREFGASLGSFLLNSSPIIISIAVAAFGVPFEWAMPFGIAACVIINLVTSQKSLKGKKAQNPFVLIFKGINWQMLLIIAGIMLFKNSIGQVPEINEFIVYLVGRGVPMEIVILVTCVLVTFPTGNMQPSFAVVFPFILPLNPSLGQLLLYSYVLYGLGFLAYYTSPLHMCQVLSVDYFKTTVSSLMRQYRVILPLIIAFQIAWYFVLRAILL